MLVSVYVLVDLSDNIRLSLIDIQSQSQQFLSRIFHVYIACKITINQGVKL